jgi:hypothetical protein
VPKAAAPCACWCNSFRSSRLAHKKGLPRNSGKPFLVAS